MTREVLKLKDTPIEDIMIPLDEVEAISEASSYKKVLGTIARATKPCFRSRDAAALMFFGFASARYWARSTSRRLVGMAPFAR